jgi:hypothetical protein
MTPAETFTALLSAIDALDWDRAADLLAEEVAVDYTSLWGGEPQSLGTAELLDSWRQLLPGFEATQHLTGPVLVDEDGDAAVGVTTVRGYHHAGERGTWMCAGRYDLALERAGGDWRVSGITLVTYYEDGDRALTDQARARVADGKGGRV